jgi:hypothetical protein
MCLACEQGLIWAAYLDSQAALEGKVPAAEQIKPSFDGLALRGPPAEHSANSNAAPAQASQNPFCCDDPSAE